MNAETHTIVFDFDGTIADSERLMLDSLNAAASEFGFKPLSQEEIPQLRKLSARELATRRLRIPLWKIWKLWRLEKRAKEEFAKRSHTLRVFPGVAGVIARLRESGRQVGIVSSDSREVVERVVREAGIIIDFIYAGSLSFRKAHAISSALREHGMDRRHAVYIGDEIRDVEACKRAGIPMIAVGWGLNDAETLAKAGAEVVRTPEELQKKLFEQTYSI